MTSRTKESLIAQHEIAKRKSLPAFSLLKAPDAGNFKLFLIFLVLGLLSIAIPFVLPDFGKQIYRSRAIDAVRGFELTDEISGGQFKLTPYSGDTKPNPAATFLAVSILTEGGKIPIKTKGEANTQTYIQSRHDNQFNRNTKEIYQGIVQLKALGLLKLNDQPVNQQIVASYYNLLLQLTEKHSAFRMNVQYSASVEATYYAFEAIKELGKFQDFKQREEFDSSIHFVASMKDGVSKGFRNSGGENATLSTTWYAVQVLANKNLKDSDLVAGAYEGVERFVLSCQANDGGFAERPIESPDELQLHSKSSTTSQAIFVLEFLRSLGLITFTLADSTFASYYDAISYLRSTLSLSRGVVTSFPSYETDLEATYYFLKLVDTFPGVVYGTPRGIQMTFVGVGVLLFIAAMYSWVSPQLPKSATKYPLRVFKTSTVFLFFGALALFLLPQAAIPIYLIYACYLTIQYYEISKTDTKDGVMLVLGGCHSFVFLGVVMLFLSTSPEVFANLKIFYVLTLWSILGSFVVSIIGAYTAEISRVSFVVNASFLGWVTNTLLFYSLLYGHGEMSVVYRLLVIHGHFPLVFIVLPLVQLAGSLAAAAYGGQLYLEYTDKGGRKVEKKEEDKKAGKEEEEGDEEEEEGEEESKPAEGKAIEKID